jgi:hypothetical protein
LAGDTVRIKRQPPPVIVRNFVSDKYVRHRSATSHLLGRPGSVQAMQADDDATTMTGASA